MSTHLTLTGSAALATLASAAALLPLVDAAGWLAQAAGLVAAQAATGALARRLGLVRPQVVGVQLLASLLLLTWVFAAGEALLGVVPGPAVYARFAQAVEQGARDVAQYAVPAPVTDDLRLVLVGGVLLVGLAVDALAVTYRNAAVAGLPLLALYSMATGLAEDHGDPLRFLCAAAGYLLLLLAEGRQRLSEWGRLFTDPGRPPGAPRARVPVVTRTGRRVAAAALGLALLVPTALPSLGDGLLAPAGRPGAPLPEEDVLSAVDPVVALQDSLNQPENRTALTYRTDAADRPYLRVVALDDFDGAAWRPARRPVHAVPDPLPRPPGLADGVRTRRVTVRLSTADWYAQRWLPMPYPADRVRVAGRWRFEPEGRTLVGDRGQTTRGLRYEVESLVVEPTAEELARAPRPPRRVSERYTEVPASLPSVVHRTAREVTAGAVNDYQRALRLQDWFARDGGFTYDTEVQVGTGSAAIVNFLRDREGFCVHFAFSMAAMARTLGIPARVAIGFTPGTALPDGRMAVGTRDAHAWPELYFAGAGWTRFEPTPTRGSTPPYAVPEDPGTLPDPDTAPSADDASTAPDDTRPRSPECAGPCGRDEDAAAGVGGVSWGRVLGVGAALAAGVALSLLPLLWRRRLRARRLRDPDPLTAWAELTDVAWDLGIAPDDSATPRVAASRLVRRGGLRGAAAEAAHRLARAVEETLYAPPPHPVDPGLAEAVRRVGAGLSAAAGRRRRLRALLLPPSTVRVVWAARERGSALAGRLGAAGRRLAGRLSPARRRARP